MSEITYYRFVVRRGTAADLAIVNEINLQGEYTLETDTRRMKMGDGVTPYNDRPYLDMPLIEATGGTVDAMTVTAPLLPFYDGYLLQLLPIGSNTASAPTVAFNGGAAQGIFKGNSDPLEVGDIAGAGHRLLLSYVEGGGGSWLLMNPATTGPVDFSPSFRFTIDTGSIADSDPGAGLVKYNHATQSSATFLYFDDLTSDGVDLSTYFLSLGTSGYIHLMNALNGQQWQVWKWSAITDGTGYFKFAVTLQAGSASFADAVAVNVMFIGAGGGGASVIDSIADGDTTNAPSRNATFDALALKANDSAVVHIANTEDITGLKTFSNSAGTKTIAGPMIVDRDGDTAPAQDILRADLGQAATRVIFLDSLAAWQWGANSSGNHFLNAIDASAVTRQVAQIARATGIWDWKIEPTLNGAKLASMTLLDAGGYFTTDTVESALQQLAGFVASGTKGPLVPLGTASTTATTTLATPTFDMSQYRSVRIEFAFDNATGSAAVLSLLANADATATNYYEQATTVNNATATDARANDARIGNMDANETCTGIIELVKDNDGKVRGFARISRGAPASIISQDFRWVWNSVTNPTSFTFSSSIASSITGSLAMWGLRSGTLEAQIGPSHRPRIYKTADESRNTTVTLATDGQLVTPTLNAPGTYVVRGKVLFETANATMDFKWGLIYTGTATSFVVHRRHYVANAAAGTDNEETRLTDSGALSASGPFSVAGTTTGKGFAEFEATIRITSSGTFGFQWSQDTSNASNLTVLEGSYIEWEKTGANSGGNEGTTFPLFPVDRQRFFRTDLGYDFFYNLAGLNWLSVQEFIEPGIITEALQSINTTAPVYRWRIRRDFGVYITKLYASTYQASGSGANYYGVTFNRRSATNVNTQVGAGFNTSADTAANWVDHTETVNAVLDASAFEIQTITTKTGTPGNFLSMLSLGYRLIGP